MKPAWRVLAGAATLAAALWLGWPAQGSQQGQGQQPLGAPAGAAEAPRATRPWLADWPPAMPASVATPAPAPIPAALSLAQTRLHGDPDAPPIARELAAPARPTAAQLADPAAYQAVEEGRKVQVLAAWVKAVDTELPRLREDIARGRAMGIAAERIAKAEEKARGLESMRAQLLKDHPALGR
jgi:hypothetical protein